MMQLCSRCNKRMAVVFVTKLENGESKNEGLCLKCAREIGIPQVDSILSGMGISSDDLDNMEDEITNLVAQSTENTDVDSDNDDDDNSSRTPALDFAKLFGSLPFPPIKNSNMPVKKEDEEKKRRERYYERIFKRT